MKAEIGDINPLNPEKLQPAPELMKVQGIMAISDDDRAALKKSIQDAGEVRDPLRCYYEKGKGYFILSGINRWEISKELGLLTVPVQVVNVGKNDREDFAIDENRARRQLTADQKRNLTTWLLKKNPGASNREIAKQAGVDDKTAGKVRKELEATAEIPQLKQRIGADGKTRKQPTKKKPTKPVQDAAKKKQYIAKEVTSPVQWIEQPLIEIQDRVKAGNLSADEIDLAAKWSTSLLLAALDKHKKPDSALLKELDKLKALIEKKGKA